MKKLRILSVSVGELEKEGAQSLRIASIVDSLRKKGNRVKLVTLTRGLSSSFANLNGFMYEKVPLFNPFMFMKNSLELLYEFAPDVIIGHTHHPTFILSFFRKIKMNHLPLVFDMHGFLVEERKLILGNKSRIRLYSSILLNSVIEKIAITTSLRVLCVSRSAMFHLNKEMKVKWDAMIYVPNGVDLTHFKPLRQDHEMVLDLKRKLNLENKFIFGYIGGLQKWQGVENFIKAAFLADHRKMGFLIVGGRDEWIKKNVVKLRRVSRNLVPYYYSMCDVLVLPRPYNIVTEVASPTKFAEYLAMGKPLLVTNVGDPAIFTKRYRCGIVLPDNETSTLLQGFHKFVELSESDIKKMGKNSRRCAEKEFDWSKIIEKLNFELIKLKDLER